MMSELIFERCKYPGGSGPDSFILRLLAFIYVSKRLTNGSRPVIIGKWDFGGKGIFLKNYDPGKCAVNKRSYMCVTHHVFYGYAGHQYEVILRLIIVS